MADEFSPDAHGEVDPYKERTNLLLLRMDVKALRDAVTSLQKEVEAVEQRERDRVKTGADKERNALIWGILFLGGIVTTLGGIIWQKVLMQ